MILHLHLQFHSLALSSNLFHLPINLSVDRHLNHLFKCAQHVICSHHLMKHKVYNTHTHTFMTVHTIFVSTAFNVGPSCTGM